MYKNPVKIVDYSRFQIALGILVCPAALLGAWMMWDDESIKFSSMARLFAFLGIVFFPYSLLLAYRYHTCGSLFVSGGKLVITPWKQNLASVRIPIDGLDFRQVKLETDDEGRLVLLTDPEAFCLYAPKPSDDSELERLNSKLQEALSSANSG